MREKSYWLVSCKRISKPVLNWLVFTSNHVREHLRTDMVLWIRDSGVLKPSDTFYPKTQSLPREHFTATFKGIKHWSIMNIERLDFEFKSDVWFCYHILSLLLLLQFVLLWSNGRHACRCVNGHALSVFKLLHLKCSIGISHTLNIYSVCFMWHKILLF